MARCIWFCLRATWAKEIVHLEIDIPELNVSFFQRAAAEFLCFGADGFAEVHGLLIFIVGMFLEPEFLVPVADIGERTGRLELRFHAQLLVGNLRLRDANAPNAPFDSAGLEHDGARLTRGILGIDVSEDDQIVGKGLENAIVGDYFLGVFQHYDRAEHSGVDRVIDLRCLNCGGWFLLGFGLLGLLFLGFAGLWRFGSSNREGNVLGCRASNGNFR
jgi:hypothetical protein